MPALQDDAHRGLGTSDGIFGGDRYFVCEDNDGLFVSLDKISPDPFPTSSKSYAFATDSCQFKMDERVMVFNKQGKEVYGRVRWCGDRTKTTKLGFTAVGIETVGTHLFLIVI